MTPSSIATKLRAAGWVPVGDTGDDWLRPGPHPDIHSFPVADLILRTNEPHHPRPESYGIPVERPPQKPTGVPRKTELIRQVATLRETQGLSFQAIAGVIGGSTQRARYLYSQADKINRAAALPEPSTAPALP